MQRKAAGTQRLGGVRMDTGDTTWVLVSAALVLFMTPGLALFYGGMVRGKNVLNMLMMNFFTISIVTLIWILIGFTLAFGVDAGGGLIGKLDFFALKDIIETNKQPLAAGGEGFVTWPATTIPPSVFMAFQMMFAIITPALITGAIAERMKFSAWVVFCAIWSLVVYSLVAHWAFAADGWIFKLGARDFAGGLVVHINAGVAALALVMVLGPRRGFGKEPFRPHSLPLTLLGTGILWFGWFGFNAGSALGANPLAGNALVTTHVAASLAALGWVAAEWMKTGKPTTLGAASGAVAGLVAITPCAGFVGPIAAIVIGVVAGILCFLAVSLKFKFGYDDSLDVVGVHLVGGVAGSIMLGVFAQNSINPGTLLDGDKKLEGLIYGGGGFFVNQIIAVVAVLVFSFVATYIIAKAVDLVIGLRADEEQEHSGLDISLHEERGYVLTEA
jgi:ammonium transporter, Amt family